MIRASTKQMRLLAAFSVVLALAFMGTAAQNPAPVVATLAGKWHFLFDTEGGPRDFDADFTLAGDKVGGTFNKSKVKGATVGERFELEFPTVSEEAGEGTLKIIGKVTGEKLTGSWSFQAYEGTFTATRPAADKEPSAAQP